MGGALRYVVIGAGAVGGTVGALLARDGHQVVLAGRPGPHLDALRSKGLRLGTPAGTFTVSLDVVTGPDEIELDGGDVLLVAVKSQDTAAVLAAWSVAPVRAAAVPAGTGGRPAVAAARLPVFCLQNGVENERQAARRFAEVYGGGVQLPVELVGPGEIHAVGSPVPGIIELGRYPDGASERAERVASDLAGAGFSARVTDRVMDTKYTKLLRNLTNAVFACCGSDAGGLSKELSELAIAEAESCYRAAGIGYLDLRAAMAAREQEMVNLPVNGRPRGGSSIWQSLHRRTGDTEADFLNGEIVLLGRLHGVPTPVNELLRLTVNDLAARRRPPGSVNPADLLRAAATAWRG